MISRAQAVHSTGELIRMLAMQALALDGIGDHEQAQDALREAVGLAAPEGYIWLWLNAGPGIEPLLLDLKDNSDISQSCYPYLDAILQARQTAFEGTAQRQTYMDTDLLTPRELEIVHLIGKGYSNSEIASELVVTLNTIKKHTSNIYSKLGVRSRTQAVARAQELNLL